MSSTKIARSQSENFALAASGSKSEQNRDMRGPFPLVGRQIPLEPADAAGDLGQAEPLLGRAQTSFDMFPAVLGLVHVAAAYCKPSKIDFASLIARILPQAICRGRWLKPHELVMMVCSGASHG